MFYLENTLARGYSAHMVLNRPYSRTHESFKSLDVTDQSVNNGLHIPNGAFAQELAHEVITDISAQRLLALRAQSNVNPTQLMLGRKNPKQPYIRQYGDTA